MKESYPNRIQAISPFLSVFKRLVSQRHQKVSLCGNGLKWKEHNFWLAMLNWFYRSKIVLHFKCCFTVCHTSPAFNDLAKKPFENTVGNGENAGNQHFLLFPQCFPPFQKTNFCSSVTFILSSPNAYSLDESKILLSSKGLILSQTTNLRLFQTQRVCGQFQIWWK